MQDRTMAEIIRNHRPFTLGPDATVAEACAGMYKRRIGAVLVVEDGDRLVGIFTGRDAVRCLAEGCDAAHTPVERVMTRNPDTLTPEQGAIDALRLFHDGGFRHLPICHDGRVRGIVSRYDFRSREHARLDEETGYFEMLR